jgi:hypothetical protein
MADDTGFLSRWSRRKVQARDGMPALPETPLPPVVRVPPAEVPPTQPDAAAPVDPRVAAAARSAPPAPTLADVAQLTRESDYTRFVAPGVEPGVRNAALKQLFTDPHFNVMDGLDTYIDDYNRPDPLPASMLRQMVQAKALGLFTEDEADASADADAPPPLSAEILAHEDTDLRLQPHDAAGRPGPEPGAGQDGGREL